MKSFIQPFFGSLALLSGCAGMKEQAVSRAMEQIWNEGDLSVVDRAYTPELAAEVKRFVTDNRALYPDIQVHIDNVIVKGDQFVTQWTVKGTHRDLGKPVTLSGVSIRRYEGGVFVEESMIYDLKAVYDQLGFRVVPPAGVQPFDTPGAVGGSVVANAPIIDTGTFPVASGKFISKEALIHAPPAEVFRLWSTAAGWNSFFGVDARIDLRVGGPYEILFGPPEMGEGNRGGEGCQVLAWVPDQSLVFSWNAPPDFQEERGQHTFVLLSFADDGKGNTVLALRHMGFGIGGRWDEVQGYFEQAWGKVFEAVQAKYPAAPPTKSKK